jgi:uncharacterized protein with LGFP repeats
MSAIDDKYSALGGAEGFLGAPKTTEKVCPDGIGHYRHFTYGSIYWHPSTGAHEIHGSILARWSSLGFEKSILGYPKTDETKTPDNKGRYNHFQNGSIYWHPDIGAFEVHGAIRQKWAALGWEKSILGYPRTNELTTPDTKGRYNHFQYGSIYWHPDIGAFEVHGAIRQKWASLGWEKSFLGYPKTDETATPDTIGRYNHFQNGSIYWHPNTGAHEVHGAIRSMWAMNGWEKRIGYPKTDETPINSRDNGRYNNFQKGSIGWTPDMGTWFDYTGTGDGRFSGNVRFFQHSNYNGTSHSFSVNTNKPLLFKTDFTDHGLHDNISSVKMTGIPATCSLIMFADNWSGKYTSLTGKPAGAETALSGMGHLNDKITTSMIVNHGTGSVILTPAQVNTMAKNEISSISVSGIKWEGSPSTHMIIGERCFKIRIQGVVEATWPDSDVKIDIYFRPCVAGARLVKVELARWWAQSGGSFAGYANSTILNAIKDFFKNNSASLENKINDVLKTKLEALNSIPDFAAEAINIRRINIIPSGVEVVLSDTDIGALLLATQTIEGLSTNRPAGKKSEGTV